jgi:hypothetical protein
MEIHDRIESKITQGDFLVNMLRVARSEGPRLQHAFVEHVGTLAERLSGFLRNNGQVQKAEYNPTEFWPRQKGLAFGFVDGGVASIDLPGASPLGIRVGSYVVRPGDETDQREEFKIEFEIVDDLYAETPSTFDVPEDIEDRYDDRAKLRDAARIISEIAAALALVRRRNDLGIVLVHGPLINPAAPYGPPRFPHFTLRAAERMFGAAVESEKCHFVPLYRDILEQLHASSTSVFGVVERDGGGRPLLERLIIKMYEAGDLPDREKKAGIALLRKYDLSDAQILDVVLEAGEYLVPTVVMRQEPSNKWPELWKEHLKDYPNPLTTFLKPSETVRPFRVETFEGAVNHVEAMTLILATARLLPGYGFPVALDIVDKFAKVPNWLSKEIGAGHKAILLRKAFETDDRKLQEYAIKMLSVSSRDWFFRPKA